MNDDIPKVTEEDLKSAGVPREHWAGLLAGLHEWNWDEAFVRFMKADWEARKVAFDVASAVVVRGFLTTITVID